MVVDVANETTAAHEAGHATVYLACGIPVQWVEIRAIQISLTIKRFGYTQAAEDAWMSTASLCQAPRKLTPARH